MKKLLPLFFVLGATSYANSSIIDRLMIEQKSNTLNLKITTLSAQVKAAKSQYQFLEEQITKMSRLYQRGAVNNVRVKRAESALLSAQIEARLYRELAASHQAEIDFIELIYQAKYGEATDIEVADASVQLQKNKCAVEKLKYELEDARLIPGEQVLQNIKAAPRLAKQQLEMVAVAEYNKIFQLRKGYLNSWRQCKRYIGEQTSD